MDITIVVLFDSAATHTPIWAHEEDEIDFRREPERAARCTTAFAALELKHHLDRSLIDASIAFAAQRPAHGCFVELRMAEDARRPDEFVLAPEADGVVITGYQRAGLLYGAYELLRLQGWRWYAPGKAGEIAPPRARELARPEQARAYAASFSLGRGFDFEYASMESAELWLWMARNRLNVSGFRRATAALANKLGLSPKTGGHIFEAILDPDRPMPAGRTLWEEHPDWYGRPEDGVHRKETAQATQFCVSQPDLIAFLAGEFLRCVTGRWDGASCIDVWGFDTWGRTCACADCRALGNSADQMLFFLARLRDALDRAQRDGRLDRDVRLATCAYEGTATLVGPTHPVPSDLIESGDCVAFYPINRCYAHDLADPACGVNARYQAALASWLDPTPALPFVAGEYYNVSKYEDLPLLFTARIRRDLPAYHAQGARGVTYMHVPMVNWAMRTLTQVLYAQLAWDVDTDVDAFLAEYFADWYGPYAGEMRHAYELIEDAWRFIADWRAWAPASILSQLLAWNGAPSARPLQPTPHFETPADAVVSGRHSLLSLNQAMAIVQDCRALESQADAQLARDSGHSRAANPIQARALEQRRQYELRLGEDRRLLRYGLDVMVLMTECVAYHDALRTGDRAAADAAWQSIECAAESLDSYYLPIGYEWPAPGLESKDGLTRSQLREVARRCRSHRKDEG